MLLSQQLLSIYDRKTVSAFTAVEEDTMKSYRKHVIGIFWGADVMFMYAFLCRQQHVCLHKQQLA